MQLACSRTWTALNRQSGKIDTVVVYKVDRLTRSFADFAKLVELFDQQGVSFLSITRGEPATVPRPVKPALPQVRAPEHELHSK
jgi:hypothetical protein